MTETWKPIPGYPGYDVSNQGRVRSYKKQFPGRAGNWGIADKPQRILKPQPMTSGYEFVHLCYSGKITPHSIHSLVLLVFVGPCPKEHGINHIDGCKTNNRLDNLEYATPSENMHHAYHVLGCTLPPVKQGPDHPDAKLTAAQALEIRTLYATGQYRQIDLAQRFNVVQTVVSAIVRGDSYKNVGGPTIRIGSPLKSRVLSHSQIDEIRHQLAIGNKTGEALAKEYNVSGATISEIKLNKRAVYARQPYVIGKEIPR